MRKLSVLFIIIVLLVVSAPVLAEEGVAVKVDDNYLTYSEYENRLLFVKDKFPIEGEDNKHIVETYKRERERERVEIVKDFIKHQAAKSLLEENNLSLRKEEFHDYLEMRNLKEILTEDYYDREDVVVGRSTISSEYIRFLDRRLIDLDITKAFREYRRHKPQYLFTLDRLIEEAEIRAAVTLLAFEAFYEEAEKEFERNKEEHFKEFEEVWEKEKETIKQYGLEKEEFFEQVTHNRIVQIVKKITLDHLEKRIDEFNIEINLDIELDNNYNPT